MNRLLAAFACVFLGFTASHAAAQDAADQKPAPKYFIYTPGCKGGLKLAKVTDDLRSIPLEIAKLNSQEPVTVITGPHEVSEANVSPAKRYEVFSVSPRCGNVTSMGVLYHKIWAEQFIKAAAVNRAFIVASY